MLPALSQHGEQLQSDAILFNKAMAEWAEKIYYEQFLMKYLPIGTVEVIEGPIRIKMPTTTGNLFFQFGEGAGAMARNYDRMKETGWIGADKYYHCMGNCQATNYGPGGAIATKTLSYIRTNLFSKYFNERDDWWEDDKANKRGQIGGCCENMCREYAPESSPGPPPFPDGSSTARGATLLIFHFKGFCCEDS